MRPRFRRFSAFLARRLAPEGVFGLHLSAGVAALLCGAALFGALAHAVASQAPITHLDGQLAQYFHARARPGWTMFMLAVTHLHSQFGVLAMASVLGGYFYRQRLRYWLLALTASVPGGMLMNVLLKYSYQRARPQFDAPLLSLSTYSFPSGHTSGAMLFYGLLAAYLFGRVRTWPARAAIALLALALVALVGLSRVYLGVHYLSDVLAGVAFGLAWLAVCITAAATLRRHRAQAELQD